MKVMFVYWNRLNWQHYDVIKFVWFLQELLETAPGEKSMNLNVVARNQGWPTRSSGGIYSLSYVRDSDKQKEKDLIRTGDEEYGVCKMVYSPSISHLALCIRVSNCFYSLLSSWLSRPVLSTDVIPVLQIA